MPQKLNKIAKEFNVGITTIVEFLAEKGYEIENDPNLVISDEMHNLIIINYNDDRILKSESIVDKTTRQEYRTADYDKNSLQNNNDFSKKARFQSIRKPIELIKKSETKPKTYSNQPLTQVVQFNSNVYTKYIDYGTIDWFDNLKGFGIVRTSYNGNVFIHENNITGTPKAGDYAFIGEIRRNNERSRVDGKKITIYNQISDNFYEEIFKIWLLKKPLSFNADVILMLSSYSDNLLKKIINSNNELWQKDEAFLDYLYNCASAFSNNNQSFKDIINEYFFAIWKDNGNKLYDKNLERAIGSGNHLLLKALQIDYNWIKDARFIRKFNVERFSKNVVFSFLKTLISNKLTEEYDDDINWIINNGDDSIFPFILEFNYLYSNDQFISDFRQSKQRFTSENFILFLYSLWIFKGDLKFNEDIKWILHNGNVNTINKLIEINYSNWLKDIEFIATLREFNPYRCAYDKISIFEDFIFNVWNSSPGKRELDENLKWLIRNDRIETLNKIVNQNKKQWLINQEFIDYIRDTKVYSNHHFQENFLFEVFMSKNGNKTQTKELDKNLKWLIQNASIETLNKIINQHKKQWLINEEFIDYIRETTVNNNHHFNEIFLFDVYMSKNEITTQTKELDKNLKWLIRNARIETLNKIINQNKKQWLINEEFIDYIRETMFYDNNVFKENFLFEVCMSSIEIKFNENIKWLFQNTTIEKIKTILLEKIGYKSDIIAKIYLAHFPFNNIDFYEQKASISNWSWGFTYDYIHEQTNNRDKEFSKLFLKELEAKIKILIKRKSTKKETHAATDLANFVFCPASYVINQSFYIDIQEQENVFIGTQEHEKQRLLSLSDSKKLHSYRNEILLKNDSQFFNRIFNSKCISQGHSSENSVIYYSKKKKLSGIPDYIFQDSNGFFAVEEKYTIRKYEELTDLYSNHKIQALTYLYGLDEFQFNEVFVLYWFVKKNDSGDYYVYNYRLFCLTKTMENEKMIVNVFNVLESVQNRIPYSFTPNQINYKKCIKCNYFPYCEHKKGNNFSIVLPALQNEHNCDKNNNLNITPTVIK
jgi:hypothetical protein